jgi:hypothetical protein
MTEIYKLLSLKANLERKLARLQEDIDAEWKRLKDKAPRGFVPAIDAQDVRAPGRAKSNGNKRKTDTRYLLEMARRLEQDQALKPWPTARIIARSASTGSEWNSSWRIIDDENEYNKSKAKRLLRKFQNESGKRHRCLYLICASSSKEEITTIVETHKRRIGKSIILEEDISDEYLEELRAAAAEGVRRDKEMVSVAQSPSQ